MSKLLALPSEIRNQIWNLVFANQDLTPETSFNPYRYSCGPCESSLLQPEWFHYAFQPLLTCRQVWLEAQRTLFSTMTLHISCYSMIHAILNRKPDALLHKVHTLTLHLHLDEDNRSEWYVALTTILRACSNLQTLTLHNHMRPPMSYENLTDAVFFAAPLTLTGLMERGIHTTVHYDYIYEDVMFASPFLGEIRCSDALEEHSAVVKDLIEDPAFRQAAPENDFETMTARLVTIARSYEQPWFQRLQRRRLAELTRQSQEANAAVTGSAADEGDGASSGDAIQLSGHESSGDNSPL